ncbi:colicin import membrane protein [Mariprofundus micogutta]|uniref:Colicin import membrane protein n=1 Tax=Mariprofundus micogutta TaxID=1921010 RepID=A0A1L8CQA0_9PROT|nr:cell envelope integrity protein TolA [Mariprofundus micogutta]GAV21100.1 colicin import membrane protein [Mariprofundus micogutta]
MSPSRTAKYQSDHSGDLGKQDLLFALLLHMLVFTIVMVMAFWQGQRQEEPLKRIEVMMISAKELARLEQQARRKPKPTKQVKAKEKAKPKASVKPKPKAKVKPVLKLAPARAKPKPQPKQKRKAAEKVDPDFDPFAPVASTTDRSESTLKASTSRPDIANIMGQQLSKNELERYIALMQARVQDNWKVPASADNAKDPLVEMQLAPTGEVVSVKILESSGNDLLDASLIRAIHAAAPFELPRQQFEFFRVNRIRFHPLK